MSTMRATPRRLTPAAACWLLVAWVALAAAPPATVADEPSFRHVDIDRYIERMKPRKQGTRELFRPVPVTFDASVKQHPHPRKVQYLYTVLDIFPLEPRPQVNHRMFVTTPGGRIIPVYVEDGLVERIRARLREDGQRTQFNAYHVYTYSKGPALLVVGFEGGDRQ